MTGSRHMFKNRGACSCGHRESGKATPAAQRNAKHTGMRFLELGVACTSPEVGCSRVIHGRPGVTWTSALPRVRDRNACARQTDVHYPTARLLANQGAWLLSPRYTLHVCTSASKWVLLSASASPPPSAEDIQVQTWCFQQYLSPSKTYWFEGSREDGAPTGRCTGLRSHDAARRCRGTQEVHT